MKFCYVFLICFVWVQKIQNTTVHICSFEFRLKLDFRCLDLSWRSDKTSFLFKIFDQIELNLNKLSFKYFLIKASVMFSTKGTEALKKMNSNKTAGIVC